MILSWNASPSDNVVGYNVYYGVNSQQYTNLLAAGNNTSLQIPGLVEGKTYYFAASAVDVTGLESDLSAEVAYWVPSTNSSLNLPPTIGAISDQTVSKNSTLSPVPFVIGDPDSPLEALTLGAFSSYPALVPVANIVFGGTDSNRTVQITPAVNQSGIASIGIIVTDETGNSTVRQFNLTVIDTGAGGTTPLVMNLRDATLAENSSGTNLSFVVMDSDTPISHVSTAISSDNSVLFPASSFSVTGTGTNRVLHFKPAINRNGTAHLIVSASDEAGHIGSCTNTIVVLPSSATSSLELLTSGDGGVTPNLGARPLTGGKKYSIAAMPAADSLFVGWSGDVVSTSATLNFTFTPHMVLQANFIPNPFIPASGAYTGLFSEDSGVKPSTAGLLTTSITRKGAYTGKLKLAGATYSFSGKMNLLCVSTNRIKRGTNILTLTMQADQTGQITGKVAQDSWSAPLQAMRAAFNSKTNPAPQAGRYTMMIHGKPDPALPAGHSFGYVKVTTNGLASFVGSLADGTKVSQSAYLSKEGWWPFYIPLYSGKGLMVSWQTFRAWEDTDLDGDLVWIKPTNSAAKFYPAGFEYERHVFGQTYVPPVGTNVVLDASVIQVPFAYGNLPVDFVNWIRLESGNKISNFSSNKLTLSFSLSTGVFKGTVADPLTLKNWSFNGIVLQGNNVGYGFVTGTNSTGEVALFPN